MIRAILLGALLLLTGCSASFHFSPPEVGARVNELDILKACNDIGMKPIEGRAISDGDYDLPTEAWVRQEMPKLVRSFKSQLQHLRWVAESGDCDDFAFDALTCVRRAHRGKAGIAFGIVKYTPQGQIENHWINFAIVPGGKIIFYDPDSERFVEMQSIEVRSCLHYFL